MSDETTPQDSAAMSPASAGSHGSNGLVAYYVHGSEYDTGCEFEYVTLSLEHAAASGGTVATLVRLTDEEREAVDAAAHAVAQLYVGPEGVAIAATLRTLVERLR